MIELHLIGYTEDGDHLVFDLDAEGEGRYLVPVEPDLLATLEATRRERIAQGKPVDAREPDPASPTSPVPAPQATGAQRARLPDPLPARRANSEDNGEPSGKAPPRPPPGPRRGAVADPDAPRPAGSDTDEPDDVAQEPPATDPPSSEGTSSPEVASRSDLSPAQIQARLRAGRSVRAVAREAGADPAWVERWHAPIVAERERVLADARSRRIDRPRARPLGAAVDRSLLDRGVSPEEVVWRVVRGGDGLWKVSVRFEEDGRARTATWLLDPEAERLRAQSPLATELSAPRGGASRR